MPLTKDRYTSTECPVIVLRSSKDWPEWRDHIQRTATLLGVWEYCDPTTEKEDLPVLEEPKKPKILKRDPVDLNEKELKNFAAQASKYRDEQCEFTRKLQGLKDIEELIRVTTQDAACWGDNSYYYGDSWKQLRTLSDTFGRPTKEKIEELENEWLKVRLLAQEPVVQQYIRGWENLFKKCVDSRIVKSPSKMSQDKIRLNAMMEPASNSWLADQPWIEMPDCAGSTDDEVDNNDEPKSDDGYWDFLSTTDGGTADDRTRSRSPSIGW